ncbi:MAG: CAAD domain-containing protein [Fischerella sp.]|nr:CAAD domain-containing protein [Fischerella sp.]
MNIIHADETVSHKLSCDRNTQKPMNSEIQQKQYEYDNITSPETVSAMEDSETKNLSKQTAAIETESQWRKIGRQTSDFFAKLPEYFHKFWHAYKTPIISLLWVFAAIIAVRIILAVLDVINDIPLAEPLFVLIGFGYTIWFTFRYLVLASTRQELATEIASLKKEFLKNS